MSFVFLFVFVNGLIVWFEGIVLMLGVVCCVGGMIQVIGDVVFQFGDIVVDVRGVLIVFGLVDLGVFVIDKFVFYFGGVICVVLMFDQGLLFDCFFVVCFVVQSGKFDFWVYLFGVVMWGFDGCEFGEIVLMCDVGVCVVVIG